MDPLATNVLFLLSRYLHIVCATLLVGGILFYEMVVPIAISDLKEEAQLAVFARARWIFRWIVWCCALGIIASGLITTARQFKVYVEAERQAVIHTLPETGEVRVSPDMGIPIAFRPGWWWAAHAATGVIAAMIAVSLTAGRQPPSHPIRWMRLDLVILLIVIFLAVATRQIAVGAAERAFVPEWRAKMADSLFGPPPGRMISSPSPTTFPATAPAPAPATLPAPVAGANGADPS